MQLNSWLLSLILVRWDANSTAFNLWILLTNMNDSYVQYNYFMLCCVYAYTMSCILCINTYKEDNGHSYDVQAQFFYFFCLHKSGMPLLMPVKSQWYKTDMVKRTPNYVFCTQRPTYTHLQRLFKDLKYKLSSPKPMLAIALKHCTWLCFHIKATADVVG